MTPPSGGEPSPAKGTRLTVKCPRCGLVHELPPIAPPAVKVAALQRQEPQDRAPELEDATPTVGQPIDRRTAPTDRYERD